MEINAEKERERERIVEKNNHRRTLHRRPITECYVEALHKHTNLSRGFILFTITNTPVQAKF